MLTELDRKNVDVKKFAQDALEDKAILADLLEGVLSKKEKIRFNCFKVLLFISEKHPRILYTQWEFFVRLLQSDNTYLKYIATYIIANLAQDDPEGKFERVFNRYYALLDDKSIIPASHVAANSPKIAEAKPHLQTKIVNRLLDVDKTHHKPERKDLIKSYVIEAFGKLIEGVRNKKKMIEFVREQREAKSPKTRKKAKEFMKRWEGRV
jgi:hypothetical protein